MPDLEILCLRVEHKKKKKDSIGEGSSGVLMENTPQVIKSAVELPRQWDFFGNFPLIRGLGKSSAWRET